MSQPSLSELISSAESGFEPSAAPSETRAPSSGGDRVAMFVEQYRPVAERASEQIGVSPDILLGQWGLETGWGKSVIPGTNNLGNIKGKGVAATDNMTGSRDQYRAYGSALDFGDDYARLISRSKRYSEAVGVGSDAQTYFSVLKRGGYAEDPNYVNKSVSAVEQVRRVMGFQPGSLLQRGANGKAAETQEQTSDRPGLDQLVGMYDGGPMIAEFRPPVPPKSMGDKIGDIAGMAWSGAKDLASNAMATGQTVAGNLSDVELLREAQQASEAEKPEEYQALMQEIAKRKQANPEAPWWQAIGDVGDAAWKNKLGTAQMIASQAPNSAAILGGAWAGGKAGAAAGSVFGPGGALIGGTLGAIGGMFLGNYLIETGSKSIDKAEGGFTQEERGQALTEGAKKAAIVTGVDMATLGAGNLAGRTILGGAARAGAKAEAKVLADAGIDITSRTAVVKALSESPELFTAAKRAGELAAKQATTMGVRTGRVAGGVALETVGEGAGEYYGEMAATGKGDIYDAALEALSSFPQSAAETAWNINETKSNQMDPGGIVRAAAQKSDSPLSRAAVQGMDSGAADQAQQAGQPQVDPITSRVQEIEGLVRSGGVLDQLRDLNIEGLSKDDFLQALATARNTKLDQQTPLLREQALEKIEKTLQVLQAPGAFQAGQQWQGMGINPEQGSIEQQKQDQASALRSAEQAGQAWQNLGITDPAQDLGAQRANALGESAQEPGQAWQAMQAGMQPSGETSFNVPMSGPAGETSSLSDAPAPAPSYTPVPAPKVSIPQGTQGTAQVRKRKAELGTLVSQGFDTITKDASGTDVLVNQKTGQSHALTFGFDKKLAKDAIQGLVREAADQSPNSPNNDLPGSTEAQNKAGNYLKPPVSLNGFSIRVENPKGSTRSGTDPNGKSWSVTMGSDYGYINGTKAADGDGVDVYVGDSPEEAGIYVIDQVNPDGTFDEPKVVMGVRDEAHARQTYLSNYEKGWTGLGAITPMTREQFDGWLKNGGPLKPTALPSQAASESVYPAASTTGENNDTGINPVSTGGAGQAGAVARGRDQADGGQPTRPAEVQRAAGGQGQADGVQSGAEDVAEAGRGVVGAGGRSDPVGQKSSGADRDQAVRSEEGGRKSASGVSPRDGGLGAVKENNEVLSRVRSAVEQQRERLNRLLQSATEDKQKSEIAEAIRNLPQVDSPDGSDLNDYAELAAVWQKIFGATVYAYADSSETAADGFQLGEFALVNLIDRQMPLSWTLAHEFKHLGEYVPAFSSLYNRMWSLIPVEARKEYLPYLNKTGSISQEDYGRLSPSEMDTLKQEMLADFMGRRFTDRQWLSNLGKTKPSLFANFIREWIPLLNRAIGEIRAALGKVKNIDALMRNHLDQLEEMKAVAMDVAEAWAKSNPSFAKQAGISYSAKDVSASNTEAATLSRSVDSNRDGDAVSAERSNSDDADAGTVLGSGARQAAQDTGSRAGRGVSSVARDAAVPRRSDAPGTYGQPREGSVTVTGYHYSREPRRRLSSSFYGTGLKGAERTRLERADAQDIRPRLHFYVDIGNGVRPESGVGGSVHKLEMRNLYDANKDELGLVKNAQPKDDEPRTNAWERAIIEAGFDGYVARNEGEPVGQAVLLGSHTVTPLQGRPREFTQPETRTQAKSPPSPVTRRVGDKLVRRLATGEFKEVAGAKGMLFDMAPSFKVEFGEASVLEREAPTVNAIMEEQGANFRFSARDFLPEDISQRLILDLKSKGYKALDGDVIVVAQASNGKEARLTVNAKEAMLQLDRRQEALEHVKECLL